MSVRILQGDCLDVMATLEASSVDVCVTDPPYGLKFMGRAWDHGVPGEPYWREVLRVLKPGAHLLAFGGTRTHHRLMCAIEDAGFEIRDALMWLHGQGFPKGKGQLKPAWEPIILARKVAPAPWLNIDACRLRSAEALVRPPVQRFDNTAYGAGLGKGAQAEPAGRWPANVVLSHEDGCREVGTKRVKGTGPGTGGGFKTGKYSGVAGNGEYTGTAFSGFADSDGLETVAAYSCSENCPVRLLDEQSGERPGGYRKNPSRTSEAGRVALGKYENSHERGERGYADHGGASRFYFCAKASAAERRPYNDHPTVKPLALMRWLVRLITPAGGLLIDPFCGSGSTLVAADREGFSSIGIDSDPHAIEIARRRLTEDAGLFADVEAV